MVVSPFKPFRAASYTCGPSSGLHSMSALSCTGDQVLETVSSGIETEDLDILAWHEAGFLDGLDGANSFLIIVGKHALDVLSALIFQPGFHDCLGCPGRPSYRSGKR